MTQQKILLLRYSDFKGFHTIDEHKKVINKSGSCWYGKFGKVISKRYLDDFTKDNLPATLFLFTAGSLHRCKMTEYTYDRPTENYPTYYDTFLFTQKDFIPHVFFKLTSIEKEELNILENFVVVSSGKPILYDLKKSISSFIVIQDKETWVPVSKPRKTKQKKKNNKNKVVHSCIYRLNGMCTNRRSVNYQYECENPNYCLRQKIK